MALRVQPHAPEVGSRHGRWSRSRRSGVPPWAMAVAAALDTFCFQLPSSCQLARSSASLPLSPIARHLLSPLLHPTDRSVQAPLLSVKPDSLISTSQHCRLTFPTALRQRRSTSTAFRTRYRALHLLACSPRGSASIRFLFVAPALCFRLPSDLGSPQEPLPSANASPCRVCRGLSPPSRCALPGAPKKRPATSRLPAKSRS